MPGPDIHADIVDETGAKAEETREKEGRLTRLGRRWGHWHRQVVSNNHIGIGARLRMLVRQRELWLVLLAVGVGCIAGLVVVALHELAYLVQTLLYTLPPEQRLSGLGGIDLGQAFIPAAGGIILGAIALLLRNRKSRYVDLVEGNALHGGRLSMVDSLIITGQTVVSNGFGASVGLEAAYTQMGGGIASKLGDLFQLRRVDLRRLVGCGAAGAIAAAFGAPLTGAFYAFELIIGTYTIGTLAPVMAASIAAVLVSGLFGHGAPIVSISQAVAINFPQIAVILLFGLISGGLGIVLMRLVTWVEAGFKRLNIPNYLRPAAGGLLLGGMALISPKVLSSGHAALQQAFESDPLPIWIAAFVVVLKITASAVSLGSGFRGGLFFASLFLGAMVGQILFAVVHFIDPSIFVDDSVPMLVGMAGLAAAIVGGPLTMAFLTLETSGSLPLTVAVLASAVASSMLVRETFGYSFTTWRFHLRGETIRSAHDVGLLRNLTVGKMMRRDLKSIPLGRPIREFRRLFPLGSAQRVIVMNDQEKYAGMIYVSDAYGEGVDDEAAPIDELMRFTNNVLHPAMAANDAARIFDEAKAEALAVVTDLADRTVIGTLTEAHLLRRYSEEP
ncbi:chloride channel protein [Devosia algicola]|uniref:Chloride channel protein n=1 Tax=Devosia algicola TaxID=3026418 RepID=A0ABY7YRL6_9HYPH|nr:chloride channel protein [Devosia algicola]WDR03965.1 chloride channel protein [Devosia algicola]